MSPWCSFTIQYINSYLRFAENGFYHKNVGNVRKISSKAGEEQVGALDNWRGPLGHISLFRKGKYHSAKKTK